MDLFAEIALKLLQNCSKITLKWIYLLKLLWNRSGMNVFLPKSLLNCSKITLKWIYLLKLLWNRSGMNVFLPKSLLNCSKITLKWIYLLKLLIFYRLFRKFQKTLWYNRWIIRIDEFIINYDDSSIYFQMIVTD